MTAAIYFRPAIPLLLCLIGGILLGSECGGHEIWALTALSMGAGLGLRRIHLRKPGLVGPILLFFSLGYLSIAPWASPRFSANHLIHFADSGRWDISGRITSRPQFINNRARFILQVASLGDGRQTYAVSGKLQVTAVGELPELAAGDKLQFASRLRSITNFKNPGGFDYRRYMAFEGIWATAYATGDRLAVIDENHTSGLSQLIDKARTRFIELSQNSGTPEARAVLSALIIGDRAQISPETRQSFNRAGLGHLLAISGLHIGIVATVAFVFFNGLMVRFRPLLWRAWTRKVAALLSLIPVVVYGVVAGFSPSTQRAVLMVAVFLLTFLFERDQDSLNTLALAALFILIADPPALFSVSFQLSFTAVFAIIYGLSRLRGRAARQKVRSQQNRRLRLKKRLSLFALVSLLAICGSLPLVAYYFNQISLIGLAANFIVVPLIGFITIPLGLTALFMLPISLSLASACLKAANFILDYTLQIVNIFAGLPFAALKIVTPSLLEIGCFYTLGWAVLNLRRFEAETVSTALTGAGKAVSNNPADRPPGNRFGQRRFLKYSPTKMLKKVLFGKKAQIAVVLVFIIMAADVSYWHYQRFGHPDLRVTVLDVGFGSAALLELPGGHTILIDGGGFADNSTFDIGQSVIAPFLWRKKIRTVDTLILSHPDSDHLNGLIYIADHFNVKNVITNNEQRDTLGYGKLMDIVALRKISQPVFENMPRTHRIADVELTCLYPPPDFLEKIKSEKWRNLNNNSLVWRVSMGTTSFLFPGDIMAEAEKELVSLAGSQLTSTVLIVPHHGSRSSSSKIFVRAVNPEVVIISAGHNSRLNLPHPDVIRQYRNRGCSIWRTDINGAVRLATDGRRLQVKPFEDFGFPDAGADSKGFAFRGRSGLQ
jgi:competence protein ComEC